MAAKAVLLYGRTGSGKTAQIGRMAEYVMKKFNKKTRLYTGDLGGIETISPHIELGIIDVVPMRNSAFGFLNKATDGYIYDDTGKWTLDTKANESIGLFAFEGLKSLAEAMMVEMEQKAAAGVSIGGGANVAFQVGSDDERMKVSGFNMAMYGVAQSQITKRVWASRRLPGEYVLWTSTASKENDEFGTTKIIGPEVIGKALTQEVPRWFDYTMRIDTVPANLGKKERHILYLGTCVDSSAGNAAGLGNARQPLDAPPLPSTSIEPADLPKAIQMLSVDSKEAAKKAIQARLKG